VGRGEEAVGPLRENLEDRGGADPVCRVTSRGFSKDVQKRRAGSHNHGGSGQGVRAGGKFRKNLRCAAYKGGKWKGPRGGKKKLLVWRRHLHPRFFFLGGRKGLGGDEGGSRERG